MTFSRHSLTSRIASTRTVLVAALCFATLGLLSACGALAAPDLDRGAPPSAEAARSTTDRSRPDMVRPALADPYVGMWMTSDLAFDLTHDTTIVIGGGKVWFYSGQGTFHGETVVVSAFDAADGLALYVDRFIPPDVLEPVLYGHAKRSGTTLLYNVSDPTRDQYVLSRSLGRDGRRADAAPGMAHTEGFYADGSDLPRALHVSRARLQTPVSGAPGGGPDYAYAYGDWRYCMAPVGGAAVTGALVLGDGTPSHIKASTGLDAPVHLTSVELTGPHFAIEGVVLAGRRVLPLHLSGTTLNDDLWAEVDLDGETFAMTAARGRLPATCSSLAGARR